jgi:bifunctional non-homologous end joining protein LigD
MLPHIVDRPLVLVRCPEGRDKACFFQKHPGAGTPSTLRQVPIREKNGVMPYLVVDDAAALVSLAQLAALEIHAWGSRIDKLEQPDRLIFDLDPDPEMPWGLVVESARQVREVLQELGLESFVKTTGGKGLHLVVPIQRRVDWDEAKVFCKRIADLVVTASPQRFTAKMAKVARPGKIFIDYLRNARGATSIVAYSTRARPHAPISVPLTWDELSERIRSDHYTLRTLPRRLASLKRDPWQGMATLRQNLTAAMKKLRGMT